MTNLVFNPSAGQKLTLDNIPEWDKDYLSTLENQRWMVWLVHDPYGEEPPTLEPIHRMDQCSLNDCEELSDLEVEALWHQYKTEFDLIAKVANPLNPRQFDVYFAANPINDFSKTHYVCQNPQALVLKESLTRPESVVLEAWLPISEQTGFAACDIASAPAGEFIYRMDLSNPDQFDGVQEGLRNLVSTLSLEFYDHNNSLEDPNPHHLPLPVTKEEKKILKAKGEGILNQLLWEKVKEGPGKVITYGLGILIGGYITGYGFADAAYAMAYSQGGPLTRLIQKFASRPPTPAPLFLVAPFGTEMECYLQTGSINFCRDLPIEQG